MTVLTIKCAWCGKITGEKDGKGNSGETATICPECAKRETIRYKKSASDHVYLTRKGAEEIKKRMKKE